MSKIVICITGMPGSGKNIIRQIIQDLDYNIFVMGDEVRDEARLRNMAPTPSNLGDIMIQIRKEEGPDVLARRCIPKMKSADSKVVIVDGVRSLCEVERFRKEFPRLRIIAIHSSPRTRFKRLMKRRRSDDPCNWKSFLRRDKRELSVGLGCVVATSDYVVINEGTKIQLKNRLYKILIKAKKEAEDQKGTIERQE